MILATAMATVAVGYLAVARMKPVYQATAELLVRAAPAQVSSVDAANPLSDLLAMAQPESIDTQMEVLRSQPFLDEVFRAGAVSEISGGVGVQVGNIKAHVETQ